MNSIYRRVTMNYCWRTLAILLVAASSLLAYPTQGQLFLTGAADYVGPFTLNTPGGTETGNAGGFVGYVTNVQPPISELFCDDFLNALPQPPTGPDLVNVSSLGDAVNGVPGALADTRFGGVTSWNPVQGPDPGVSTANTLPGNTSVKSVINGATALQRYEMVAFLITQYSFFSTPDTTLPATFHHDSSNEGIQAAIWAILNPVGGNFAPPNTAQDPGMDTWLTNAATWLVTPSSDKSFLSRVMIVTDAQVAGLTGNTRLNTGIQELMYVVPEPSFYALVAVGLGLLVWRRKRLA